MSPVTGPNSHQEQRHLSISACVCGHAYRLVSRNLTIGVFDGETGFIGIREKMGSRYLFREYHWDQGAPYGTVRPLKDLGALPSGIAIAEDLGTIDRRSKRPVRFDRPVNVGGRGWCYVDTGAADQSIEPISLPNKRLFTWLNNLDHRLARERR